MADEKVTLEVEVEGVDKASSQFGSLKSQLREARLEFERLQNSGTATADDLKKAADKIDDVSDKLDRAKFSSGQFEDKLAALPGPLGNVGRGVKGVADSFATFGKGLTIALGVVGLIVGAFAAMKESLQRTEQGTRALTRITEAFERILNGLFAIIEPLALQFADLVGGLLENEQVMKGLARTAGILAGILSAVFNVAKVLVTFTITNWITAFKSLAGVLSGVGDILKGVFTFDFDAIKQGVSKVKDTVVTGFTTIVDNTKESFKDLTTGTINAFTSAVDGAEKSFTEGSKRLTKREREEKKKRDEQAAKDAEEEKKKRLQRIKEQEEAEEALRKELSDARKQREKDATIIKEQDEKGVFQRKVDRENMLANNLATVQNFATKTTKENTDAQIKIEEEKFKAQQALLNNTAAAINAFSDLIGRNTLAGKALAVAATLINTYASIAGTLRAFAGVPVPGYAIAQSIATGLVGLKAVRDIIKTPVPTTGGGGSGGGGGAAGGISASTGAPPPVFSNPNISAPQVGASASQSGTIAGIVAGTMNANQSQTQPLRAYVVQNDIRTESQLDRRVRTAARLGG